MTYSKWLKPAAYALLASALILPSAAYADAKQPKATGHITQVSGAGVTLQGGVDANSKGFQSVDLSKFKTKLNRDQSKKPTLSTQQGIAAADLGNHDPNSAIYIDLNTLYQNTMSAAGQQDWYFVYVPDASKLTALLPAMQTAGVNYDVHLFHMNDTTGALENEQYSAFGAGNDDQVSMVAQPGYYFLCVNSVQGFDATNPYLFEVVQSYGYDAAEPDDSFWQARAKTSDFSVTGNLDNVFDQDWIRFTPAANEYAKLTFDQLPTGSNYIVQVYSAGSNGTLNSLGYLPANAAGKLVFAGGTNYYLRVLSTGTVNPAQTYHLQISRQSSSIALNTINSDPNVSGYVNYYEGYKWRVQHWMTVNGTLRDADGQGIGNMPVSFAVGERLGTQSASGVTDANGNFSINLANMNPAAGDYMWYGPVSYHYYDIIPMVIGSGISSSSEQYSTTLYHYAYSIYHPF
ncbi:Ig-like domain-containing protein [Tumebacillus flagellatus]|uniref:Peptidase C-terminal archaeal/bacterial domain-containing protein n=1 Tax=Tumebacillus flagellatus TaxID=1157490 RepID=A0A074M9M8_9BACL|nr:Ig-like domain-containing protein [Tumebacillus flagellatus]KEO82637.1 hypothetical protein EL26_13795 [Tumebacillus flagellatus]